VGRITIPSDSDVAKDSGINEMVEMYDQITAFTWSGAVRDEVSPWDYFYSHSDYIVPSCQMPESITQCWVSERNCLRRMRVGTISLRSKCL
jgi:hypothetical protein